MFPTAAKVGNAGHDVISEDTSVVSTKTTLEEKGEEEETFLVALEVLKVAGPTELARISIYSIVCIGI